MSKLEKRINLFYNRYESKHSVYSIFAGDNIKDVHPFLTFIKNNRLIGLSSYMSSALSRKVLYITIGSHTVSIPFFYDGKMLTKEEIEALKAFVPRPYHRYESKNIKEIIYVWYLLQKFSPKEVFCILIGYIRNSLGHINLSANAFHD